MSSDNSEHVKALFHWLHKKSDAAFRSFPQEFPVVLEHVFHQLVSGETDTMTFDITAGYVFYG